MKGGTDINDILRTHASMIVSEAISAVEPSSCVLRALERENNWLEVDGRKYDLLSYHHIYLVGFGKAAVPMTDALERLLGDYVTEGIVITKYGYGGKLKYSQVFEGGHPIPDEKCLLAAKKVEKLIKRAGTDDLVFFLISGGGSALLTLPRDGISLDDIMKMTDALLRAGATIDEINIVRKHLSSVKGGGLAKIAYPANSVSLILSDVVGDSLEIIASGPTVPDTSTFEDFYNVLQKYNIQPPPAVYELLQRGLSGKEEETPKLGDSVFDRCQHVLVGNNSLALSAAEEVAKELGYNTLVLTSCLTGEAREVAKVFGAIAQEERSNKKPISPPVCVLAGGETTVTVLGDGKGGRAQEFSLSFALEARGLDDVVMLAAGTDGTDGPTDAAGAFADGTTVKRGEEKGLDASLILSKNNSYAFFAELGDLFMIGPTGTNVMDIYVLLVA